MMTELPAWDGPTDEAELDAIEAEAEAMLLSSKRRRTEEDPNVVIPYRNHNNYQHKDDSHCRPHRRLPTWGDTTYQGSDAGGGRHWSFARPSCRADAKNVKYPLITFDGRIVYSRTAIEVENAARELLEIIRSSKAGNDESISMGFDVEWKPTFRRGEAPRKAAVIQLCLNNRRCYVMHVIHCGIPPLLRSILEDNSVIKVGVGIANDATKMFKDYNIHIDALEDLSSLANIKLGGMPKSWSLSSLTEMLTCKQLAKPKKIRMGNWEINVLSKAQLVYAATDAFVSWYLYQVLKTFKDKSNQDGEQIKSEV